MSAGHEALYRVTFVDLIQDNLTIETTNKSVVNMPLFIINHVPMLTNLLYRSRLTVSYGRANQHLMKQYGFLKTDKVKIEVSITKFLTTRQKLVNKLTRSPWHMNA